MKKIYILAIAVFVLFCVTNVNAFSVTPSKTVLTMDPESNQNISLEIENSEEKDITFLFKVYGVRQKNDGTPEFIRGISIAESWITFQDQSLFLKSGQSEEIDFDIEVPKDARSGSYYLAIAVRPQSQDSSTYDIVGEIVSLLNIQVSGTAYENVTINKWELDETKKDKNNWSFNVNLANKGNMDVSMDGTISILSWKGNELLKQKISLGNKFLSNSVRFLQPSIDISKTVIIPSIYQAKIQINYGLLNQSVVSTEYVVFFPFWSKVILVALTLGLVIMVLFLIRNKIRRKK